MTNINPCLTLWLAQNDDNDSSYEKFKNSCSIGGPVSRAEHVGPLCKHLTCALVSEISSRHLITSLWEGTRPTAVVHFTHPLPPTLTTDLIWALKPWGAFSSPRTAGLESSQCCSTYHCCMIDGKMKPGKVQTRASSRVGAQNGGRGISSSAGLTAPNKQMWFGGMLNSTLVETTGHYRDGVLPLQTCPECVGQHSWWWVDRKQPW